ncbi:GNAT family N-acetyltransferase [Sulfitobacter pseudonitzschiae]|uniref:L-ornithine N(alpha)-acyltransferase n=2 Tax=Pseudosulfitobacter pseudonitzschiae TaxID=1402135 RepID=A0A9Q2NXY1_9RHOB|nr:GNAT family N-acyltransferase [Pseudosulfitobacter pseudonitzschiae]MBM2290869.1 GNAT family N-acetyltransferase [Pseudosulfitobacter pseudonitzschiae]MBM2295787.1 GNAT family N-acetyltransferase [Pseudosulfitobacter pseudonitzschiae]MBM2300699.1 GNAT family N-acetyltransferase [Pseudosulfitobacter pseudonitzschiae]MBM2310484.1 GNAT family N-acetyltransferase [Pseudosulfitobacter pseudonitzschiae]MBM2315396.1 GNAT family N-acetyltransferase [Pseudosulfitobacter pseudonitzschiae]
MPKISPARQTTPQFRISMARDADELMAAQRLRYDVFVRELGGGGDMVDHAAGLEQDRFDPFFDHMLLHDEARGQVVGVYRMLRSDQAQAAGQFYSEDEYDLALLRNSGRNLLELGRSCLHPDYRGGMAMHHLWSALAAYVADHKIDILFGVASFHGTDTQALAAPLSLLHHRHLAPPAVRVRARETSFQTMDLIAEDALDRRAAMLQVPALIKAYLRLGGVVGEGAWIDRTFNTTDVCLVMDTAQMNTRQSRLYTTRGDA